MDCSRYFRSGLAAALALTLMVSACGSNPLTTTSQAPSSQENITTTTNTTTTTAIPPETTAASTTQLETTWTMPGTAKTSTENVTPPITSTVQTTTSQSPSSTPASMTPATTSPSTTPAPASTSVSPTTTVRVDYMNTPIDKKELASYRYSVLLRIDEGEGTGMITTYMSEWLRDQRAEHSWKEDAAGKVTEEYIAIGGDQWSFMEGQGWLKQTAEVALPASISDQVKVAIKDPAAAKARVVKKVLESINGVYCTPFEIEYTISTPMLDLVSGEIVATEVHFNGMVYIADQLGWQFVVMLAKGTYEMTVQGKKTVVYTEQKVYDVDGDITITAP